MLHFVSNEVAALLQVIMIDLVLAGDNAIVIGLAAAGYHCSNARKLSCWVSSLRRSCG
jgi:predicted tellurium resistance membrane protein TerC